MEDIRHTLEQHYDLHPSRIELLEGYEDQTFLIEAGPDRFILKRQADSAALRERIRLEIQLTRALKERVPYEFPRHILCRRGTPYREVDGKLIRLLSYLEGTFLAETPPSEATLESLGDLLGRLNQVSLGLSPGALAGEVSSWDLQYLDGLRKKIPAVADARDRALIEYFLLHFEAEVLSRRLELRKALIHNDANDWNLLTQQGRISGLIDFGDMAYTWLIGELAVALPYVLAGRENLLETACIVIRAYSRIVPLEPLEAGLLYYLIGGRICMSLCNSAVAAKERPESGYISISEAQMKSLIRSWVAISPEEARSAFMAAAGMLPPPVEAPDTYLQRRKKLLAPSLSISYQKPIAMRRAAFQYMFDQAGRTFLDAYNNIMLVGHCHPRVVQATTSVLRRLNTNTRYLYDELLTYGEHLLGHFPRELCRVFFVNSGSAATDLALRLSRAYTGRAKVLAMEHGYHGNTAAGIAISHYKHRAGASYPDTLLGPMPKVFGRGLPDDGTAGAYFAKEYESVLAPHRQEVAAFIAEPVMGCGGQVPLPEGFLPRLYKAVRGQGGICISDEVQVGFGRLGKWYWGYEMYGVVPDMVVLGKPMGNGHPIGAVITTEAIAACFDAGPEFFSSFGGNPVSCAAGQAVLEVIEEEGLREHAAQTGDYLISGLRDLQEYLPCIGDVRGEGLFLGVELISPEGLPATETAQQVKNALRESAILIGTDGPANNVLKIKPPLPFSRENCDSLIRETTRILKKLGKS